MDYEIVYDGIIIKAKINDVVHRRKRKQERWNAEQKQQCRPWKDKGKRQCRLLSTKMQRMDMDDGRFCIECVKIDASQS